MQGGAGKRAKKRHLADFIGTNLAPDWWQKTASSAANLGAWLARNKSRIPLEEL